MKFSGKSCENFKKLIGIKKKQEKFWENFAEFLKKISICQFYKKYYFFILNTAFYRAEYGLLSSKTWQHCMYIPSAPTFIYSSMDWCLAWRRASHLLWWNVGYALATILHFFHFVSSRRTLLKVPLIFISEYSFLWRWYNII